MLEITLWIPNEVLPMDKQTEMLTELYTSLPKEAEGILLKYLPNLKYRLFNVVNDKENEGVDNKVILEAIKQ